MDDAGALPRGDIVGDQDLPRVVVAPLLDIGVVVEDALVVKTAQLGTREVSGDGCRRVVHGVVTEVFGIGAECVGSEQVVRLCASLPVRSVCRSGGPRGDDHVIDAGAHSERGIRRQRPRGGGPGQGSDPLEAERGRCFSGQREGHGHRLVLAGFVDVVVHPQLVIRQWGLVSPAIRQDAVALVGEALVVEGVKRPNHTFHKRDVECLVVVVEVDPAGLAGDIVLPLVGVAKD